MSDYKSSRREIKHADVLRFERSRLSDSRIAEFYRLSRMGFCKIRKQMGWVRECGFDRSDKGVARKDADEKRENWNRYMRKYNRENGIRHPSTRVGSKTVGTSRFVAEKQILGRYLLEGEVVHHRDGDTENNDPINLLVFKDQEDHLAYHRGDRDVGVVAEYLDSSCFKCGIEITGGNLGIKVMANHICKECINESD